MQGQSTLEYILVLAAVLAAIVIGAGVMKTKTSDSLNKAADVVGNAAGKLKTKLNLN